MTIEKRIELEQTTISYPFRKDIKHKQTEFDETITYHCTVCEEDFDKEEVESKGGLSNVIGVCKNHSGKEGCFYCMIICGYSDEEDDRRRRSRVKGCGQWFCYECSDSSPFDASHPSLCNECIKSQNVERYYGEQGGQLYKKCEEIEKRQDLSDGQKQVEIDKLFE